MIGGLRKESSVLVKMVTKDKMIEARESFQANHTPLLPTPPLQNYLAIEGGVYSGSKERFSKGIPPNLPKIELTMFTGENPRI